MIVTTLPRWGWGGGGLRSQEAVMTQSINLRIYH